MARRAFFSFHYGNDVTRANVVRNSWVTKGKEAAGFVDKAEFEKIKQQGETAIHNWIDNQLTGTSVTVVLIGEETLNREYVQYEILQSYERGKAIIGVQIGGIKNLKGQTSASQSKYTVIGKDENGKDIWFSDIIKGFYNYSSDDGYLNLGTWIENAAK